MDSDDNASSIATASTDTSMFIRELQVLNSERSTGPLAASQTMNLDSLKATASGDADNTETLPQALKLIRGERPQQIINLADNSDDSSIGVYSPEVEVFVSPPGNFAEKTSGSNKVKMTAMVNHVWDLRYYHGNLVAVHRDSVFLAYVLKGRTSGNVRIVSRKTANRNLVKGFSGAVMDIAFALSSDVYLAAVDEAGNLFVHSFTMEGDSIIAHLILHVEKEVYNIESEFRNLTKVIWCPYMPEEEIEPGAMDPAKMLVLLHGTQAEVWNVDYVSRERGNGPHSSKTVDAGCVCIEPYEPLMPVVNAAFAPDGSAIAVAYHSGIIRFFIVDLDGDGGDPECMYDWNPHDNLPVSCLYFLDDHKTMGPEQQLWKFALTGAKDNTEIKIWSCETWACVQTLHFNSPISQPDFEIQLKVDIDLSSKYFVLSDINAKVLYILQLHQDYTHATAHISSLSQFPLAQPCISFAIWEASLKKLKRPPDDSHLDEITTGELDDDDNEEDGAVAGNRDTQNGNGESMIGVQIKMYGVHNKSLHDMLIRYRPETSVPPLNPPSISSMSQEESGLRDMLSDVSMDPSEASIQTDSSHAALLLPQAFATSSPSVPKPSNGALPSEQGDITAKSISSTSSFTQVTGMNEDLLMESPVASIDPSSILSPTSVFSQNLSKNILSSFPGHDDDVVEDGGSVVASIDSSNFPLPPATPGEEEEGEDDLESTAKSGGSIAGAGTGSNFGSAPPSLNASQSLNTSARSNQSNQEILEEMFSSWQSGKKATGAAVAGGTNLNEASMDSTSSTNQPDERYDENDHEVAQAMEGTFQSEGFNGEMENTTDKSDGGAGSGVVSVDTAVLSSAIDEKKEVVWPEPPDVSSEAKRLVNEAIQQGVQEEDVEDLDDDDNDDAEIEEIIHQQDADDEDEQEEQRMGPSVFQASANRSEVSDASAQALNQLNGQISSLTHQMAKQQEMLLLLQKELTTQRDIQLQLHRQQLEQHQLQQVATQQPSLEQNISKLEDLLISRMEHSLAQHMQRETQRLQDSLVKSDNERNSRDKNLHSGMMNEMSRSVKDTLSNLLRTEIKQTVNPALHRFVEPMKEKIHQEVAQRLSACDTLLKDNIAKAVKSRSTMDVLASSVGDVIYQQMQQAYSHTFKKDMLPSLKAVMEKTVRDVNGIFQQGSKEYQLYLRQNVEVMLKERGAMEDIIHRMEKVESQFIQSVTHMKGVLVDSVREELNGQVGQAMARHREEMMTDLRKIMREEMSTALKEHGASINDKLSTYLRSGAGTPVPVSSEEEIRKERIQRELRAGRINEAFQNALTASNLDLVVFTCQAANPLNVFSGATCPLTQPVLLSLVSQLSVHLDKHYDLKMKFLSEAVMNLDPGQSSTAEHFPTVLGSFVQRLKALESQGVDPRKAKDIRMITMAANSLLS